MSYIRNVVIVGSGPAGLTAATYAARANLSPLVIEGEISSSADQPGGQLMTTTEVENYPGFPDGIQGPELMTMFKAQAARFGTEFLTTKVNRVDFSSSPFTLWVNEGLNGNTEIKAHTVIITTGARAIMLGLENEQRLLGYGVSACATCDGFFFRDKDLVVVGGGDSAIEEATFLTKFAKSVTIVHRRKELRASKIMQDRAFKNEKIQFIWDSEVTDVLGESSVEGVQIRNVLSGETSVVPVQGLFVAIGHLPNTDVFRGQITIDEKGYIITDGTKTSVDGVFAAGDVQDSVYRQAITSAGTGCMAAIDAERWLEANIH